MYGNIGAMCVNIDNNYIGQRDRGIQRPRKDYDIFYNQGGDSYKI